MGLSRTYLVPIYTCMGLSRERQQYRSKIAKFSHPSCILRPAEVVLLRIGYRHWGSKN